MDGRESKKSGKYAAWCVGAMSSSVPSTFAALPLRLKSDLLVHAVADGGRGGSSLCHAMPFSVGVEETED